jgi:aminodeoxyfutalosine synthase
MEGMTSLEMLAERVEAGDTVTPADARILAESRDLIAVGMMADGVRRRLHGLATTFVRVFEVHVNAVPASLPVSLAAGEIRIVGQPQSLAEAVSVVSSIRAIVGTTPITGFSLASVSRLGGSLRDIGRQLQEAGLDAIAEVSLDEVEAAGAAAIDDIRAGGLNAYRLAVQQYDDHSQAAVLNRAAELQRSVGGFRAFAPLPRVVSAVTPTTGYDDVKLVATARLMVTNIPSIQVDWPLYGPKLAQVALTMGADDVDGVAAFDPATLGSRRSALAEIVGNIGAAGQNPVERNGRFEARAPA